MTRPSILIVEDSPADVVAINEIAKDYGLPIVASSFEMAMSLLQSRHFDLVILDLTLGATSPKDTAAGFALTVTKTPVIVVTGSSDPSLKAECESRGWAWVWKDSPHYARTLNHAIDNALEREESGTSHIPVGSNSQLDAILSVVKAMERKQAEMQSKLDQLCGTLEAVIDTMFGPIVDARTGQRSGGCVSRHKKAQQAISLGGALLWAAALSVAGSCGGLATWVMWRLTQ